MRRWATLLVASAVAAGLVACSGGGDAPRQATEGGPEAATTTTEPTFSGAGSERFCEQARAAKERLNGLAAAATTPEGVREQFTTAAESVRALAGVAPGEIAGDVRIVVRAYDDLLDGLRRTGWDPSRLAAATSEKLGDPRVRTAGDRLSVYERKVCGIA